MRVEIREMIIKAKVNSGSDTRPSGRERSNATTSAPLSATEREAIIGECLRRMKQLLANRNER